MSARRFALLASVVLLAAAAAAQTAPDAVDIRAARQVVVRAALRSATPALVKIETVGGATPVQKIALPSGEELTAAEFRQGEGATTGVIWTPDGYIVTSSFNFLRDPTLITVTLGDGRRFVARLVARDEIARLTVLKINATDLPTLPAAPPAGLRPGHTAITAGYGHGSAEPAVSVGVVSALGRLANIAVQTDAKTSPVNYGGPLLDFEGRLIGVCVPAGGQGEDDALAGVEWYDSGIGFAVTTEFVQTRFERLRSGESLYRGLAGLALDAADPVVGEGDAAAPPGVKIDVVAPGPAADAGLRAGDRITHLDDQPTPTLISFRRVIARRAAGDEISVRVVRSGEEGAAPEQRSVHIRLVRREELRQAAATQRAAAESQPAEEEAAPDENP